MAATAKRLMLVSRVSGVDDPPVHPTTCAIGTPLRTAPENAAMYPLKVVVPGPDVDATLTLTEAPASPPLARLQ
jgi:hypothetical protein